MKTCLLMGLGLVSTLFSFTDLKAQADSTKIRELGIGFSNFNSFNIAYQWGKPQTLYSISLISIGFSAPQNSSSNTNDTISSYTSTGNGISASFGLKFGIIKAKNLAKNIDFLYGGIIGVEFGYDRNKTSETNYTGGGGSYSFETIEYTNYTLSPFIGITLGARYALSKAFFVYADVSPNINYSYSKSTSSTTNGTNSPSSGQSIEQTPGISNFSNSGASLSLVYRFQK